MVRSWSGRRPGSEPGIEACCSAARNLSEVGSDSTTEISPMSPLFPKRSCRSRCCWRSASASGPYKIKSARPGWGGADSHRPPAPAKPLRGRQRQWRVANDHEPVKGMLATRIQDPVEDQRCGHLVDAHGIAHPSDRGPRTGCPVRVRATVLRPARDRRCARPSAAPRLPAYRLAESATCAPQLPWRRFSATSARHGVEERLRPGTSRREQRAQRPEIVYITDDSRAEAMSTS